MKGRLVGLLVIFAIWVGSSYNGLVQAIARIGKALAESFPYERPDTHELFDAVDLGPSKP